MSFERLADLYPAAPGKVRISQPPTLGSLKARAHWFGLNKLKVRCYAHRSWFSVLRVSGIIATCALLVIFLFPLAFGSWAAVMGSAIMDDSDSASAETRPEDTPACNLFALGRTLSAYSDLLLVVVFALLVSLVFNVGGLLCLCLRRNAGDREGDAYELLDKGERGCEPFRPALLAHLISAVPLVLGALVSIAVFVFFVLVNIGFWSGCHVDPIAQRWHGPLLGYLVTLYVLLGICGCCCASCCFVVGAVAIAQVCEQCRNE